MNLLKLQDKVRKMPVTSNVLDYQKNTEAGLGPKPDLNLPEVTQEQADERDKETPRVLSEVVPAAFSENNITANVWDYLNTQHTLDPTYNREESIKELTKDIPQEFWGDFTGNSLAEDRQTRAKVLARMKDQEILSQSGLTGGAISLAAMVLDPVGIGMFGTEAKLVNRLMTKGSRAKNMLYHGGASANTMLAYEAALHEVHGSSMDSNDVAHALAGGFVFGTGLGAFSKGSAEMNKALQQAGKDVQQGIDEHILAGVNVKHEPISYAEALDRAMEQGIPEFPRMNKAQQAKHFDSVAQSIMKADAELAERMAKAKPVTPPADHLDPSIPDESISMFAKARNAISESWDRAVKNDGSTAAMFLPFEGSGTKGQFSDLTDKMVKIEISDRNAKLSHRFNELINIHGAGTKEDPIRRTAKLTDILEHDELYAQFPDAKKLEVVFADTGKNSATYNHSLGLIEVSQDLLSKPDVIRSKLIHEIQHAVQTRSGFARGGNPSKIGTEAYLKLAGEEEARRTEKRINLMDEARAGNPYMGTDVANPADLVAIHTGKGRVADDLRGTPSDMVMASHEAAVVQEGQSARIALEAEAAKLVKTGIFKSLEDTKLGKMFAKLGLTDSTFMMSMNSDVSKYLSYHLMENPAGFAGRTSSAAIKKSVAHEQLLSEFMPEFKEFAQSWRARNGVKRWNPGTEWAEQMNKELRVEMEMRTNAHYNGVEHVSPHHIDTQRMADALDRAAARSLELMKKSGVHGAQEVVKRPGYVPLLWMGRALRNAHAVKGLPEAYQKALARSYERATGMSAKDAEKVSKAVLLRAERKDLGLDSNPHALLSKDSREFLRQTLENSEAISTEEINALLARIDATMADSGTSARIKRRTNVDLLETFEHEGQQYSLLDLVDNNMPMVYSRYTGEASGRSALAAKGIASEADWTAMREAAIEAAGKAGDAPEAIDKMKKVLAATYEQLLSRPALGGVDRRARRAMDGAQLAILNQAGLPQLAEFAQILGSHGIRNMWEALPAVKAFRKSLVDGTVDRGVLSELQPLTGRIGKEHMLYRTDIRIDDRLGNDSAMWRRFDRITASAKDLSGWMSGMYYIKSMQQQLLVQLQADKVAKFIRAMKVTENGIVTTGKHAGQEARLADVGWDREFLTRLKGMEKHFEFDGDVLQRLNIQEWHDPQLVEQFIEGIHRHSAQLIQKPLVGETAYWMHSTVGSMLTQFRNYPLVAIEKQTARQLRMADEESFYTAMYGLGISSMVYAAKVGFNSIGKSEYDRRKYLNDRLSTAGMFKGALAYSSVTSVTQDGINVLGAFGLAPKDLVSTQVSRSGGTRGVDLSFKDIPALGYATNGLNAVGGLIKNTIDPSYKYGKKDTNALQGFTMFGNSYPAAILFNELDAAVSEDD